ncbi:tRNA (adenosine(37)-N6)-threonylcarbamoyltransferase complex dimerization subunit type 1 TsaB [Candidatus Saganbacteria bacterium CG08_land_8_20_14_0_20_45_16]|uniref:tRNA (Adenosine(37)-N6)-threonylcarbamoyltransferase complex dimerization subunit type 1 TsaB n=1 Tax=Candidatus Saganbacteria bacterium CG08_land_8_20_14_0_20_45_16 TaxID=2014293 RepID=A0A2H0Y1Y4_UNCSA|nr:MAG: tRNA (adenosine(37)-N6)-threonylcarbamoyltransferase complex dimerization subunit type 1 TsaB [Candidatus Saganbacteria bacterium CG08_land_8_20_14_0_20_45_16]
MKIVDSQKISRFVILSIYMHILGLCSATKVISIGLIDDDKVLIGQTFDDLHAEKIVYYLKEAGIKPKQIEGIAVADGPGSYSGLRGGLAAAKSMAQTLQVPLVGVPTLEAIAYNRIKQDGKVAAFLAARWDEYNFALFEVTAGTLKRLTEDRVAKMTEIKDQGVVCESGHPYGVSVAKLGWLKLQAGQSDDPLNLVPKYSHQPNIREFKV